MFLLIYFGNFFRSSFVAILIRDNEFSNMKSLSFGRTTEQYINNNMSVTSTLQLRKKASNKK